MRQQIEVGTGWRRFATHNYKCRFSLHCDCEVLFMKNGELHIENCKKDQVINTSANLDDFAIAWRPLNRQNEVREFLNAWKIAYYKICDALPAFFDPEMNFTELFKSEYFKGDPRFQSLVNEVGQIDLEGNGVYRGATLEEPSQLILAVIESVIQRYATKINVPVVF